MKRITVNPYDERIAIDPDARVEFDLGNGTTIHVYHDDRGPGDPFLYITSDAIPAALLTVRPVVSNVIEVRTVST